MNTGLSHSLLLMGARNGYKYNRRRQALYEENLLIWRENFFPWHTEANPGRS